MSGFYDDASWLLIPEGIEEDIVFAQKPTNGTGDLTFTRASDATRTNSAGVIERTPWNLVTWSEMFSDVAWTKSNATISINTTNAPNGTLTADTLVENTANASHYIFQQNTKAAASITYTLSVYFKSASGSRNIVLAITNGTSSGRGVVFSSTGSILASNLTIGTGAGFTYVSAQATLVDNGWYRANLVVTTDSATRVDSVYYLTDSTNVNAYLGNGTSGYFIWGAQLVEGTDAKPYFATTNRQDVPRLDYRNADGSLNSCPRLLLEPQRTNSIRNSTMVGASVAGNTLPTNWTRQNSSGLTQTVVGVGVENGLQYVDINLSGIATGANDAYSFDNSIVASISQTWTNSWYFKLISSSPNAVRLAIQEFNSGVFLNVVTQDITPTTSLERYAQTKTLVGIGVNNVRAMIYVNFVIGQTYNTTIRIAAPQMELGAFATTFIPTTTAAVTRLADLASKTGVSSLIGQTEGTMYLEFQANLSGSGTNLFLIGDGLNADDFVFIGQNGANLQVAVRSNNSGVFASTFSLTAGVMKAAIAYKGGDTAFYVNGTLVASSSTAYTFSSSLPSIALGVSAFNLAALTASNAYAQAALFKTRLTNAQLAQLTT
jgi:hypothetical protein